MIQCFTKGEYKPSFPPEREPRLLSASNVHMEYGYRTRALHKHSDCCEILFVFDGKAKYVVGDHLFTVSKGNLIINNSDTLHEDVLEEGDSVSYYAVSIYGLSLDGLPENHLIGDDVCPVIPTLSEEPLLYRLFKSTYDLLSKENQEAEEICHHLMMSIVTIVLKRFRTSAMPLPQSGDISAMIREVKQFLNENYMNDLSLQMISEKFFISPYHLSHFFKEKTGYSPMNFVNRRRIGEAQTLLIRTKASITEIAGQVGFSNLNNFNIQFQKQVGMSPRQYRKVYLTHTEDPRNQQIQS